MSKIPYQNLVDYLAAMVVKEPKEVLCFHRSSSRPLLQVPWNDENVSGMAKMVWDTCKSDADMRGAKQVYNINVADDYNSLGQVPLTIISNLEPADALESEGNNVLAGVVIHYVKAEEGRMRVFQDAVNKLIAQQSDIISKQATMVNDLGKRILDQQEAFEQAQSRAAERDIMRQESEASEKRKGEMLKMLMDMGPKIIAAKYGIDISEIADSAKDIALKKATDRIKKVSEFLQGFSDEQRAAFLSTLTEKQLEQFVEAMGEDS